VQYGGKDTRNNLQIVCAECHSVIHRTREAFGRYERRGPSRANM
jgi:predicted HNH restriction endonuclease